MQLSDRFELVRPLGRGATGQTYLARERGGDRQLAVKHIVLRGLGDWKPVELLQREADVLRTLSHPGVPSFIDAFEVDEPDSGPGFVVVTSFIAGDTLLEQIQRGRRFTAEAAHALLRSLLETLDYLHSLSPRVIHRDIKPANVIIEASDHPVLVDFGAVHAPGAVGAVPTAVGTAGYMAPEQALGVADPRSDLHGLGATLIHSFTHVHPSELPRAGLRPILRDLTGLDPAMRDVLARLVEPDPAVRFASAREVLTALQAEAGPRTQSPLAVAEPNATPAAQRSSDAATELARRDHAGMLAILQPTPRQPPESVLALLESPRPTHAGATLVIVFASLLLANAVAFATTSAALGVVIGAVGFILGFALPGVSEGQARRLLESGAVVRASIRSVETGDALTVRFAFVHERRSYAGSLDVRDGLVARRVDEHTPVFVFFDPAKPQRHVALLGPEWTAP